MIPVTKSFLPPLEEYISKLESIWSEGWITNNGPYNKLLKQELISYLNVSNLELLSNGTLAIQLAIKALGLNGEIITTPFSYVATTTAILWENCTPVFVDIESETFCIDPDLIEAAITPKTSAILATHVYGYPCNVVKIEEIAKRYGLKVIYDAAHAFGVKINSKSVLCYGDVSTLSFHATKLFHTVEGGAVVCRSHETSALVGILKQFGHLGEDDYREMGINAKLSEMHSAMGLCVLPRVCEIINFRKKISMLYDSLLKCKNLQRPLLRPEVEYNYSYYPVVFNSSEQMMRARKLLMDNGINPRRYFYPSLNKLDYLALRSRQECPVSESVVEKVLCLPLYYGLEEAQVRDICHLL